MSEEELADNLQYQIQLMFGSLQVCSRHPLVVLVIHAAPGGDFRRLNMHRNVLFACGACVLAPPSCDDPVNTGVRKEVL